MTKVDSNYFSFAEKLNFVSVEKRKASSFIDFSFNKYNDENNFDFVDEILGIDDFDDTEIFDDYEELLNKCIENEEIIKVSYRDKGVSDESLF